MLESFPVGAMPNWHVVFGRIAVMVIFAVKAIVFSLVLFLALLVAFHGRIIDDLYKNVDDRDDGEMPLVHNPLTARRSSMTAFRRLHTPPS
jgi:hypothetical protein